MRTSGADDEQGVASVTMMQLAFTVALVWACSFTAASAGFLDFPDGPLRKYSPPASHVELPPTASSSLTAAELSSRHEGHAGLPARLSGAISHWPAMAGPDRWSKQRLIEAAGGLPIQFSVQQGELSARFDDDLRGFLTNLHRSTHANAFYTLTEDFLYGSRAAELHAAVGSIPLLQGNKDLFGLFPADLQPQNRAFVLGGLGSVSSLHVDAYNWTGWNALLAGRKVWRFWPPGTPAHVLYSKRQPKQGGLIASYQSDVNCFATMDTLAHDAAQFPLFDGAGPPLEILQEAGDVVVIPSGWWHQVYHLSETVALASQFASAANLGIILDSILEWNGLSWEKCLGHAKPTTAKLTKRAGKVVTSVVRCSRQALAAKRELLDRLHRPLSKREWAKSVRRIAEAMGFGSGKTVAALSREQQLAVREQLEWAGTPSDEPQPTDRSEREKVHDELRRFQTQLAVLETLGDVAGKVSAVGETAAHIETLQGKVRATLSTE